MTYNIKTGKEKILRIWITIILGPSPGSATGISHQTAPPRSNTKIPDMALSRRLRTKIKKRTESYNM